MRKKIYRRWARWEGTGDANTGIGTNRRKDKQERYRVPLVKAFEQYRRRHGQ